MPVTVDRRMKEAVDRVAARWMQASGQRSKTAGEVRFIKDRGGDHQEWGWNPPNSNERTIDPDYSFDAKNLKPVAKTLRSALMALGHIQTARSTFTKIRSQRVSPDGNLGGRGYVMPIKDIRKQLANCDEALSAVSDTLYDEMQATHWHPEVDDTGGDPRDRPEVKQIMDDVEEIREDPEEWAEDEEKEMDQEGPNEADGVTKMANAGQLLSQLERSLQLLQTSKWMQDTFGATPAEASRLKADTAALQKRVDAIRKRTKKPKKAQAATKVASLTARWMARRAS